MKEYAEYLESEATAAVDPRIERLEERRSILEEELSTVKSLEYLAVDIAEEAEEYYKNEIEACERDIEYFERASA